MRMGKAGVVLQKQVLEYGICACNQTAANSKLTLGLKAMLHLQHPNSFHCLSINGARSMKRTHLSQMTRSPLIDQFQSSVWTNCSHIAEWMSPHEDFTPFYRLASSSFGAQASSMCAQPAIVIILKWSRPCRAECDLVAAAQKQSSEGPRNFQQHVFRVVLLGKRQHWRAVLCRALPSANDEKNCDL